MPSAPPPSSQPPSSHAPGVVLVTGVSRFLGASVAARLAADPQIERIIGVDTVPTRPEDDERLGRTEFVRADISNPLIAKVVAQARVTTVLHTLPPSRARSLRAEPADQHVTGTMQLLAACQVSDTVRRVVVVSTTAVYGSSGRSPGVFTETMRTRVPAARGYVRDAIEVESYTRGFARRRPDIDVTVLRLATTIGPTIQNAMTRYLAMPFVPTSLGFDPRLQLLHEDDAVEVLRRAGVQRRPGVYNVAGDGVVALSQVLRWAGRVRLPVPAPAISLIGRLVRNSGAAGLAAEESDFLNFGRVVDSTKLQREFGFVPEYSTAQAVLSYLDGRPGLPKVGVAAVCGAQRLLQDLIGTPVASATIPSSRIAGAAPAGR